MIDKHAKFNSLELVFFCDNMKYWQTTNLNNVNFTSQIINIRNLGRADNSPLSIIQFFFFIFSDKKIILSLVKLEDRINGSRSAFDNSDFKKLHCNFIIPPKQYICAKTKNSRSPHNDVVQEVTANPSIFQPPGRSEHR